MTQIEFEQNWVSRHKQILQVIDILKKMDKNSEISKALNILEELAK